MTTIHFSTTGELLQILDDHPEVLAELRRKLLTDDLLALPESARAIRETQREMQETQQRIADLLNQTADRLDALEARQTQHDASLARIESSQERMEARQDQSDARLTRMESRQDQSDARLERIEASQERMEARQDRMESTQAEMLQWQAKADTRFDHLESQQAEMLQWQAKADTRFDRIEAQQAETLQWQAKADTRFDRIEGQLGNLRGEALERRAIDDFYHIARDEFGVARTEIIQVTARHLRTISNQLVEPYEARIDAAKASGLISIEEEFELRHADFVARGYSRQDMTPVWFVAEISGTIAFDDIRRAHERTDILYRALAETVIPVVYGIRVSDRLRVVAESRGVRIAMRPTPDDENYT